MAADVELPLPRYPVGGAGDEDSYNAGWNECLSVCRACIAHSTTTRDAEIALLKKMLGECYVLAGADTNGDDPARHYRSAVEAVRELREDYDQALDELPQEGYTLRLRLALEHIARVGKASKNPSTRLAWIIDRAISAIDDDHAWKSTRKPKNYHDALHQYHRADHA